MSVEGFAEMRVPALTERSGSSAASRSWGSGLEQSPSHRSAGCGCGHCRRGGGRVGFLRLHLIDEGLDGRELVGQLAEVGLQGVELLVQVIQSLRQGLDPEKEKETSLSDISMCATTNCKCKYPCLIYLNHAK